MGGVAALSDNVGSRPIEEAETGARAGRCAITGRIAGPFDVKMLRRAGSTDPHTDLRTAGVELLARQGLQRRGVVSTTGVDDRVVEFLVNDEVAEPARAHDA